MPTPKPTKDIAVLNRALDKINEARHERLTAKRSGELDHESAEELEEILVVIDAIEFYKRHGSEPSEIEKTMNRVEALLVSLSSPPPVESELLRLPSACGIRRNTPRRRIMSRCDNRMRSEDEVELHTVCSDCVDDAAATTIPMQSEANMDERCCFRPFEVDGFPAGPNCQAFATHRIDWKDGRVSFACKQHGRKSLTQEAKRLVKSIRVIAKRGGEGG